MIGFVIDSFGQIKFLLKETSGELPLLDARPVWYLPIRFSRIYHLIEYIFDIMNTMYYILIREENDMALTSTVTFRTTPELKERVDNLAKRTRRSSGFYYNILLEDYLSDIEDIYDAIDISEKVRAGKEKTYSSDEIRKELDL